MIPFRIEHYDSVTSTNSLLLDRARLGEKEGLVITADFQTEGRGKLDRKWVAPHGKNLLCSILIRPKTRTHEAPMLTQMACRSVARTLKETYKITSEFKRPNDIMIGPLKLCGILVESSSMSGHLEYAVIGIGLNVNSERSDLPPEATSMRIVTGQTYDRKGLLEAVLSGLGNGAFA